MKIRRLDGRCVFEPPDRVRVRSLVVEANVAEVESFRLFFMHPLLGTSPVGPTPWFEIDLAGSTRLSSRPTVKSHRYGQFRSFSPGRTEVARMERVPWPGPYPVGLDVFVRGRGEPVRLSLEDPLRIPEEGGLWLSRRPWFTLVRGAFAWPDAAPELNAHSVALEWKRTGWPRFDAHSAGRNWRREAEALRFRASRVSLLKNPFLPPLLWGDPFERLEKELRKHSVPDFRPPARSRVGQLHREVWLPDEHRRGSRDLSSLAEGTGKVIEKEGGEFRSYRWSEVQRSGVRAWQLDPDNLLGAAWAGRAALEQGDRTEAIAWMVTLVEKILLWERILKATSGSDESRVLAWSVRDSAREYLGPVVLHLLQWLCSEVSWDFPFAQGPPPTLRDVLA